ncbi:hypothetical protein ACFP1I_19250 [Dyadobacter subterraneus]|uniref:AlgX/AlgJ SGNH hydrolase-like domain-containing protein n=1 Tax=Dyadobacter subterraneus TaxID=2773304 RepID=A0ABR9W6C8_9BACT|nr:hypothetical protein [Dyadobacter subterraneus]MBE9461012.1 hypothetical protein [Dyadobacter subterraneus]
MGYINKLIRYSLLFVSGIIFIVSLSPVLQRKIAAKGLIPDQYRFGDLYNTSNLLKFKEVDFAKNTSLTETDKPKEKYKNVDLYTIGDSFTPMDTSYYAGDKNFHIWMGMNVDTIKLDTAKKSILVVEIIERTIQERLLKDYEGLYIKRGFQIKCDTYKKEIANSDRGSSFWWDKFGDQINQRIEFLLFNFNPFLKLKELKSGMMLSWFDRTHTGAIISRNHEYLFYSVEADKKSELSPFHEITPASVDSVVTHINTIRTYYKGRGFDEVYFCLIPNKVTVCENARFEYNHQISLIENNPLLKTPMISVQSTIRKHPEWFHKSDGHWNVAGKRYWLQKTNELVKQWSEEYAN